MLISGLPRKAIRSGPVVVSSVVAARVRALVSYFLSMLPRGNGTFRQLVWMPSHMPAEMIEHCPASFLCWWLHFLAYFRPLGRFDDGLNLRSGYGV